MSNSSVTDLTRGVYRRQYGGFIRGKRINQISLEAEAWFWRVLAVVDDFGNAEADPEMVWLATTGRRKGVTIKDVGKWLREMRDAGLIETYKAEDEHYLHVTGFEEMQPAGKNGKRVQRVPSPDLSRKIQKNPGATSASEDHTDNHTHSDTEDQTDPHAEDHQQRAGRAEQRGTRLPDDFCLNSEMREWATKEAPHVDLEASLAEFFDYWRATPGAKGRKLDWVATWRNRMRELESRRGRGQQSKVDASLDAARRFIRRKEAEIEARGAGD